MVLAAQAPWNIDDHCWDGVIDPGTTSLYQDYARPLGVGSRPALVCIDLYRLAFAGPPLAPLELRATHPSSCGRFAHDALDPIQAVLGHCRDLDIPIIHVTYDDEDHDGATHRSVARIEPQMWDFAPGCEPLSEETVIRKKRASAFFGTPLNAKLHDLGVDSVLLIGETTSGCVRASAVDAFSSSFHVVIAEEAVFDRSWLCHCVSLFDLHHKYADVLCLDTMTRLLAEGRQKRSGSKMSSLP